jgi:serine/threonine protein kinase
LERNFISIEKHFSLKTVAMLAIQMIQRVEFLHKKYLLHNDLKPENFLFGKNEKVTQ